MPRPTIDPVRRVGPLNVAGAPAVPRAHHKFAVFCRLVSDSGWPDLEAYEVWSDSYNWTANATRSLEDAVVLSDDEIVGSFYREWEQAYAVSEPLDWDSPWAMPLCIGR